MQGYVYVGSKMVLSLFDMLSSSASDASSILASWASSQTCTRDAEVTGPIRYSHVTETHTAGQCDLAPLPEALLKR
jgi:hypothetical protein